MNRHIAALAAAALATGGLVLAAPAQARPLGPHTWCPGAPMQYSYNDPSSGPGLNYVWDMNVCHTWYRLVNNKYGNVPYRHLDGTVGLPSDVWDGEHPPNPRLDDGCDICW
jgi:hypothetical protein